MRKLIGAIIKKWFCYHEWECRHRTYVIDDFGGTYVVYHFFCRKCDKYKRIKSY